MNGPGFVHLSVHSEYSLVDSVVRIPALIEAVAAAGMPAVALTDECNLFAVVKFYGAAQKRGLKPVVGADVRVRDPDDSVRDTRLVLLCQDRAGYRNLSRLLTRAQIEGRRGGAPRLERAWLPGATDGLIALADVREGDVGRELVAGREGRASQALDGWLELFGDRWYLELQRTGRPGEEASAMAAVALAARRGVPLVATNDVRFLGPNDYEAHEARVCIQEGHLLADRRRPRRYSPQQYLRSPEEMAEIFRDLPEAIANTVEIARRCNLELELGGNVLPAFPVPAGMDESGFLARRAAEGLDWRIAAGTITGPVELYRKRLDEELGVITGMGFSGYFLIVADFVRWAREHGIPVGPGRGSGAGSLAAYALGITDLDPLRYELLFERFLNPERVSMPDFDIDFCMEGRDRVIDYVADRYGRERVAQIITHGTMAARAVVRDVGRVLGHPYGFVDRIAKLIPMELGMTLERALEQDEELRRRYREQEDVQAIIDLARALEGLARNAGKHAGGVVIAPGALTDYTPLYSEDGTGLVTQLDKDDVEAVGLVKFDFLGLRTLTIIERAQHTINELRARESQAPIDVASLPMKDEATFALLRRCDTTAVFQLESRGMRDLVKRLQPDRFEDIVALVALYRPGPLQSGMVDDFIRRKHGEAAIDYPHPRLVPVLEPTYGVILYQEQVMQIAQLLAGYTLGGADLLRRAMGKKKAEEMAKQRSVFVDGAHARGVALGLASHIFDLMEKFAGYGFNKSHSVAYAVLAYQTAWLKAHYPAAFMAAVLSSDMEHTDKVVHLIDACREMGMRVEPPDVNRSRFAFDVSGVDAIRYGLGAVKGVGEGAVNALIAEREARGEFRSLDELCQRADMQKANRRVLEALIRAGALDSIGPNRATLMARLPEAIRTADQQARASAAGQGDMFGGAVVATVTVSAQPQVLLPEWNESERLAGERDTLGLYLTGHPVAACEDELKQMVSARLADLAGEAPTAAERGWSAPRRSVRLAGLVVDLRKRANRVMLTLDDRSGRIEVTLFEEVYQSLRNIVAKDAILVVDGNLRYDDYTERWRVTAERIVDLDAAREQYARRIDVLWLPKASNGHAQAGFVPALRDALAPFRRSDGCRVDVCYRSQSAKARLSLGDGWRVRPARELIDRLRALAGEHAVRLVYAPRSEM
jgi:DNA polymerase-3 subunit alpha